MVDGIYVNKAFHFLDLYHVGDLASVLGLLVSIIGFMLTIYGVWKSKTAAQRAEESAKRTREAITSMQSIADISSVLAALGEIKRLHRTSAWSLLPDRYGSLRAKLVALRASRPQLSENQQATLQGTIQHLSDMERLIDRAMLSGKQPANISRLNSIISEQIDKLTELLTQVQREEIGYG